MPATSARRVVAVRPLLLGYRRGAPVVVDSALYGCVRVSPGGWPPSPSRTSPPLSHRLPHSPAPLLSPKRAFKRCPIDMMQQCAEPSLVGPMGHRIHPREVWRQVPRLCVRPPASPRGFSLGWSLPSTRLVSFDGFISVESGEVELSPCLRPLAQTARAVFPQAAFLCRRHCCLSARLDGQTP